MENKACRDKDKCRRNGCPYIHPVKNPILCRNGFQCTNERCSYKHVGTETRPCRFKNNCTTVGCAFRHPPRPQNANWNGRNDNKSSQERKQRPHVEQQVPQQNPREVNAIEYHKIRIEDIRDEMNSIIQSVGYNPENEKELLHVASLHKNLLELEKQLATYYSVKIRNIQNKQSLAERESREIYRLESRLSALSKRLEIEEHIGNHQYLIIEGETGSGKSTQIPQYLADHPNFTGKRILCTQPRKLATISLAHRVAYEYAGGVTTEPGLFVGYHVGGTKKVSYQNRIEFMTEGVMLEKIMKGGDSVFKNVGCIIIDEAHERSLICDLLLGTFKRRDPRWKDVLIIVTSATIDLDLFSAYFYNAPSVKIEGRCFPVEIIYEPLHSSDSTDIRKGVISCALKIHRDFKDTRGDILCFLPGQEDVLLAKEFFEAELSKTRVREGRIRNARVLALFGKQEPEEQKLVFEKTDEGTRKIIFATDVAETSVTIDGVVYVVDSGIKKEVVFDPKRNISSLKVTTISRSSAIQRAGRSGRTQPGTCYRLYSQDDFENMSANTAPEIFCKPLSLAVLTLQEMHIDPLEFDWISSPSKEAIQAAKEELMLLGAIDSDEGATELGKVICQTQQDPKLVRMIYRGCQHGYGMAAVTIASILSVANMFFWNGNDAKSKTESRNQRNKFSVKEGDAVTMYRVFEQWLEIIDGPRPAENGEDLNGRNNLARNDKGQRRKAASGWCKKNFVNGKAMFLALSTKEDLLSLFRRTNVWKSSNRQNNIPSNQEIQRLVLAGYFVHTARLFYSKNVHIRQYYALQSDVSGKLDQRAAILNYNLESGEERESPNWITYDKLFRHSTVIFPTTNAIEESWLKEENPNFYEICLQRTLSLPTELIVKFVSQECLREILGKYFSNIDKLEKELNCSIGCDLETGRMTLCCTSERKAHIVNAIQEKVATVLQGLEKQVIEMEHVGGTRFVVGQGFQITDVLFPQDFSTLYIRNVSKDYTLDYLKYIFGNGTGTIQLTDQNNNTTNTAIAKFSTKHEAKTALERFRVIAENIGELTVSPKLGIRKGTNQTLSCRLKLSWAMGCSTGKANIAFHSPEKANEFIERVDLIFPEAKITMVHGENPDGKKVNLPPLRNPLPRLRTILLPRVPRGVVRKWKCRFRFDTDAINLLHDNYKQKLQYKITVDNLPRRMDEHELLAVLRPYQPKWINVDRVKGIPNSEDNSEWNKLSAEEKIKKLAPLQEFIKNERRREPQEFFDKNQWRAGLYIYFDSNSAARAAFNGADYHSMELSFGQPHRLEIEFTHLLSINIDLFKHLEKLFSELRLQANFKGINVTEPPQRHKTNFIFIKFQTWHQSNIRWIQEQLVEITSFEKFSNPKLELLFTRTGRRLLEPLMRKTFIYVNHNSLVVLIYGNAETKEKVATGIKNIIDELKSMDLIDEEIVLDKKKVNVNRAEGRIIDQKCDRLQINYHHFRSNRLYVSGKREAIESLKRELKEENMCRSFFRQNFKKNNCDLCFDTPEGKFITTSACEHIFCIECIQPMFEQLPPPFPIKCPACEKPLVINDISNCATQTALLKVLEVAVKKYGEEHPDDIRKCPNLSCTQLLSYHSRTTGSQGGDFLFCDECIATYCLTCSTELKKPIKSHEDDSCEDIQNGSTSEVGNHIRKIQEKIFNLSCPRCKTAFYEFDGCAAVSCGTCKCGFCGLCLADCGSDAHAHVLECQKNSVGGYYLTQRELDTIHRKMKTEKLREYLKNIRKQKVRKAVFTGIRKDLIDLGIKTEMFSDVLDIPGEDIQNGSSSQVGDLIREIQEKVFNLSCPRCKIAFYEFDGCAAVSCGTCKCGFCGLCLADCGTDAHAHVVTCKKNPGSGVAVTNEELEMIHREMKTENLREFLKDIRKQKVRKAVFTGIQKDLIDLGIKPERFSAVLDIPSDGNESDIDSESEVNEEIPNANVRPGELRPQRVRNGNIPENEEEMLRRLGIDMAEQRELMQDIERDRRMLLQRQEMMREERRRNILREQEVFRLRRIQEDNQRAAERLRQQQQERQRNERGGDCHIL